jgi:hypothetical protein
MFVLETQVRRIQSLALGANGQLLGLLGLGGPVSLWDLPQRKHKGNLAAEIRPFLLTFAPTGSRRRSPPGAGS